MSDRKINSLCSSIYATSDAGRRKIGVVLGLQPAVDLPSNCHLALPLELLPLGLWICSKTKREVDVSPFGSSEHIDSIILPGLE